MKRYTEINREETKELADLATDAMRRAFEGLGVEVEYERATYSGHDVTLGFRVSIPGASRKQAESDLDLLGATSKIGDTFKIDGHTYTITDFVPRRRKYPVTAVRKDGRQYKFTVERADELVSLTLSKEELRARIIKKRLAEVV